MAQTDAFDHDIQTLRSNMSFKRRGDNDDYRTSLVPSIPLLRSQVFEGEASFSSASIFRVPDEILAIILENVDEKSLGSLALVDRGFRQLARSRQFSSVLFDYRPAKWELLKYLAEEGKIRADSVTDLPTPSIGICIRRFKVDTRGKWFNSVNQLGGNSPLTTIQASDVIPEAELKLRLGAAKELYLEALRTLEFAFTHAMPNLQLVDWEDRVEVPTSLLQRLLGAQISHIKLSRIRVNKDSPVDFEDTVKTTNIRTLDLDIKQPPAQISCEYISKTSNAKFASSLLRLCAPTLEILDWTSTYTRGTPWTLTKPGAAMPIFTHLHNLDIRNIGDLDDISLESFLKAPLSRLAMSVASEGAGTKLFQRGNISTLRTLLLCEPWPKIQNENILSFLENNAQLTTLIVGFPGHTPSIYEQIIRLLSAYFTSLTFFGIRWYAPPDLQDSILLQLAQIKSLEHLYLGLTSEGQPYSLYPIDHARMREFLHALPNLKRVAFQGDSYPELMYDPEEIDSYYQHNDLRDEAAAVMYEDDPEFADMGDYDARRILWERQHAKDMLKETRRYIVVMPKLEWIYFGQLGMSVYKTWKGERCAKVLEEKLAWTLFKDMIQWEGMLVH